MSGKKQLYLFLLAAAIGAIVYTVYINFFHDPQAAEFLSHKSGSKRPINTSIWLDVMKVHIIFACAAAIAGAFNFSRKISRDHHRKLHRIMGYLYVGAVIGTDLTSGYMAPYSTGGKPVSIAFNMLNIWWMVTTVVAIIKIRKKQTVRHRQWMVRSYAFCFTNLFIHLIAALFHNGFGFAYTVSYMISVYGSIVILIVLAEIVNRTIFRKNAI
ncbi:DUF2306 domain-containing protein [Paenibacillus sp. GCM10027626]|uniref:DUF2306 domain-containing protein n=1 Tax=Paenibacillus sp. GCM10027626 TaxID=3273411 RepID=UPI00362895D6